MIPFLPRLQLLALALTIPLSINAQPPIAQRLDTTRVSVSSRVGTAANGPRSMTVIDRAEIDGRAARSVADVIGWGLGVDLMPRSPAQSDLAIRGSSFEQVVVLVRPRPPGWAGRHRGEGEVSERPAVPALFTWAHPVQG